MKKGTGFGAPAIGTPLPKGATIRIRKDGKGEIVLPKKAGKKKK